MSPKCPVTGLALPGHSGKQLLPCHEESKGDREIRNVASLEKRSDTTNPGPQALTGAEGKWEGLPCSVGIPGIANKETEGRATWSSPWHAHSLIMPHPALLFQVPSAMSPS